MVLTATKAPGLGEVTAGSLYNESSFVVLCLALPVCLSMKGGPCTMSTSNTNISYLENISMEFLCGTDKTSLRSRTQCQHIFSLEPLNLPENCQIRWSKTWTWPASNEFLFKIHFRNERYNVTMKSKNRLWLSYTISKQQITS